MYQKKYLNLITFVYGLLSVIISFLWAFSVYFHNFVVVAELPVFDCDLLSPIKSIIVSFVGDGNISDMLYYILGLNLLYGFIVLLPFSMFNYVKGVFNK